MDLYEIYKKTIIRLKQIKSPLIFFILIFFSVSIAVIFSAQLQPSEKKEVTIDMTNEEKAWLEQNNIVQVRVVNFPYFLIIQEGKPPSGLSIDYLNLIAERTGINFEYIETEQPFSQALDGLKHQIGPDLIATIVETEERNKYVNFTQDYIKIPRVIFTAENSSIITGMSDLSGKTVSLAEGTVVHRDVKEKYPDINLQLYYTDAESLQAVSLGRADAYIGNLTVGTYLIIQNDLVNIRVAAPTDLDDHIFSIGVRKDWPELRNILNKGLDSISNEERQILQNKYLSVNYEYGIRPLDIIKWVLIITFISGTLLLIIMLWNRRLNKEIKERISIEEELKKSQKILNETSKIAKVGGWEHNLNTNELLWTDEVFRIFELDHNYIPTVETALNYFLPDDRPLITDVVNNTIKSREPFNLEVKITTGKGNIRWVNVRGQSLTEKGTVVKTRGTFQEIDEIKKLQVALEENELRFRELFQNMGSSVAVYNAIEKGSDFVFIDFNKSAEKLEGLLKEDIIGKKVTKIFPGVEKLEIFKVFKRVWETGIPEHCPIFKYTNSSIEGWRENYIYKLPTSEIVVIYNDITKRKQIEEQLAQSQKMDSIGQLAGGMAHDFNNVLAGIINAAQLLQLSERKLDKRGLKYIDLILQASGRAADLISKLLAFGRKRNQSYIPIDIHNIIDETIEILYRTIDKKISISLLKNAENINITGDHSGLESMILNLCINASHAMGGGGKIQIRTENIHLNRSYCDSSSFNITPGEYCQIEVRDTGSGISMENLKKIFEPFYTTKEQGKGTGLGLSAVYGIIQDHHGEIQATSEVGTGTSFLISLPCSEKLRVKEKDTNPIITGLGTVLLVDDEEFNRTLGTDILESLGYDVFTAEDGWESIEFFEKKFSEIDIVLMDMIMPVMNGSDAFIKMKEIDQNCKVIIATGYTKDEDISKLMDLDLAGIIKKPYKIPELSQLLNEVMKN